MLVILFCRGIRERPHLFVDLFLWIVPEFILQFVIGINTSKFNKDIPFILGNKIEFVEFGYRIYLIFLPYSWFQFNNWFIDSHGECCVYLFISIVLQLNVNLTKLLTVWLITYSLNLFIQIQRIERRFYW